MDFLKVSLCHEKNLKFSFQLLNPHFFPLFSAVDMKMCLPDSLI